MADDLAQAIREAAEAVAAADVPDDLREVAFSKALDAKLGLGVGAPSAGSGGGTSGASGHTTESTTDAIVKIARKCNVATDQVDKVLEEDGDAIHITASRSKFAQSQKQGMQQVALLISAARQAAGLDEDATPLSVIKDHCDEVGVLDEGNFSRHMAERRDGVRVRGPNRRRELKVNNSGFEAAGKLISDLADGTPG
jgi:hypothetical protein